MYKSSSERFLLKPTGGNKHIIKRMGAIPGTFIPTPRSQLHAFQPRRPRCSKRRRKASCCAGFSSCSMPYTLGSPGGKKQTQPGGLVVSACFVERKWGIWIGGRVLHSPAGPLCLPCLFFFWFLFFSRFKHQYVFVCVFCVFVFFWVGGRNTGWRLSPGR